MESEIIVKTDGSEINAVSKIIHPFTSIITKL